MSERERSYADAERDRIYATLRAHRVQVRTPAGHVVQWPPLVRLKPGCVIVEPSAIDTPRTYTDADGTEHTLTERDALFRSLDAIDEREQEAERHRQARAALWARFNP